MPEVHMKYARPGRCARRGANLNSAQEPNHWKTPKGFQFGLPGQHEQELPIIAAKLLGVGSGLGGGALFRGTKLEKHFSTVTKEKKF